MCTTLCTDIKRMNKCIQVDNVGALRAWLFFAACFLLHFELSVRKQDCYSFDCIGKWHCGPHYLWFYYRLRFFCGVRWLGLFFFHLLAISNAALEKRSSEAPLHVIVAVRTFCVRKMRMFFCFHYQYTKSKHRNLTTKMSQNTDKSQQQHQCAPIDVLAAIKNLLHVFS